MVDLVVHHCSKWNIWECKQNNKQAVRSDGFRVGVSSTQSCLSHASGHDDIESLRDVFVWGEVWSNMASSDRYVNSFPSKSNVTIPKLLEKLEKSNLYNFLKPCISICIETREIQSLLISMSNKLLGVRHFSLVRKQGDILHGERNLEVDLVIESKKTSPTTCGI
ncbi:hypothetical protein Ccrd_024657 [Cynara cardunculus var. scolymus]|uniref:Uncharacterized protein n=1 Tax=Cynara cardunculus var. scolymus TaxID=59895 RepID=A0A103XC32_CYNCS|nr:hypothetical protein Ccrd_024657 [Cynara cardunculus var. scolymus]